MIVEGELFLNNRREAVHDGKTDPSIGIDQLLPFPCHFLNIIYKVKPIVAAGAQDFFLKIQRVIVHQQQLCHQVREVS